MDRLPPLNSLRAFEAVARHMSFQKAADELFVTPAALSYQIRQLEEHLDTKLFNRLNRAIELTDHGKLIAPGIADSFVRLNQTMRQLSERRKGNVLVISCGPAFTAKWLSPRLYRFIAKHPEIDARISANLKTVDLAVDDVDVAIRFGRGAYPGCTSVKLLDEYVTPMCSPALLEGRYPLTTTDNLKHHTLIHDDTPHGVFHLENWRDWLEAEGIKDVDPDRGGLHFNVADHALDAAIGGAGVVMGRHVLAQADIESGRLVMPFSRQLKAEFSFYAVTLESRSDDKNIAAFVEWLEIEARGAALEDLPGPAV